MSMRRYPRFQSRTSSLRRYDASGAYRFEKIEAFGGINNLLNTDPPPAVKSPALHQRRAL